MAQIAELPVRLIHNKLITDGTINGAVRVSNVASPDGGVLYHGAMYYFGSDADGPGLLKRNWSANAIWRNDAH